MSDITLHELTDEQFESRFRPITNHLNARAPFDGWMFETYGEELAFVQTQPANRIWTLTDCDGQMFIESGWHFVNRLGYIVTAMPFEEHRSYSVACEDLTDFTESEVTS